MHMSLTSQRCLLVGNSLRKTVPPSLSAGPPFLRGRREAKCVDSTLPYEWFKTSFSLNVLVITLNHTLQPFRPLPSPISYVSRLTLTDRRRPPYLLWARREYYQHADSFPIPISTKSLQTFSFISSRFGVLLETMEVPIPALRRKPRDTDFQLSQLILERRGTLRVLQPRMNSNIFCEEQVSCSHRYRAKESAVFGDHTRICYHTWRVDM